MSKSGMGWLALVGAVLVVMPVGLATAPADIPKMDGLPTAEPEAVGMSSERGAAWQSGALFCAG